VQGDCVCACTGQQCCDTRSVSPGDRGAFNWRSFTAKRFHLRDRVCQHLFSPLFFFFFSPFFLLLITLTSFQCLHWSFSQAISSCCTLKNCDNMSVICGQTDRRFKHCFSRPVLNLALVSRDQYLAQRPANSSALCDCQHHKTLEGCTYINYVAIAMWYFVKNCCETPGE